MSRRRIVPDDVTPEDDDHGVKKRRNHNCNDNDSSDADSDSALDDSFEPVSHWITHSPRSTALEITVAANSPLSLPQQRALRVLQLSARSDLESHTRHRVWWIATAVDWFTASGHILSPVLRYRTRALAAIVLELFYRFVWAQFTSSLFIDAASAASATATTDIDVDVSHQSQLASHSSAYASRSIISDFDLGCGVLGDDDDDEDDEDDEDDDDEDDEVDEGDDVNDQEVDDDDEASFESVSSVPDDEMAPTAESAIATANAHNIRWSSMSRLASDGTLQLPGVVNLYFSHPRLNAAIDLAEEQFFAQVGTSTDTMWSASFDIGNVLVALAALVAERENVSGEAATTITSELFAAYESIYVPWLSDLGLQSETDTSGAIRWKWHTEMLAYVRAIYIPSFVGLTQGGVVSRSSDFCELFGELLLSADSRVDTSLASATLLIESALAANGQFDAEVGRLMALLDQLTTERERWRATLAVPFDRAVDGAAPAPLHMSSQIRDQLQAAAEARLTELDTLIRNVEDALHLHTAHYDDVVAAPRRERVQLHPAERMLRRRADGDDEWAHSMFEFSSTLSEGALSTALLPRGAMSLHAAWSAWLAADTSRGSVLTSVAMTPNGQGAAYFSIARETAGVEVGGHEPFAAVLKQVQRVLKGAVCEQAYMANDDSDVVLPVAGELEAAILARAAKDVTMSAQERSCASERGGTLYLLREALQHWISSDVEPQLRAHRQVVQIHRRDCSDRRRKPPAFALNVDARLALNIAMRMLELSSLSNLRSTLAFVRKLLDSERLSDVLLAFSAQEFFSAMWCDERRVSTVLDFGALDVLKQPPLTCTDRCPARLALTLAATKSESVRIWIAGRINVLRFELGNEENWDLYHDSLRLQPLAIIDQYADSNMLFDGFYSEGGVAPATLSLAQHALRGASPFAPTTMQLYRALGNDVHDWQSPTTAVHACTLGDRSNPLWFAVGASLIGVAISVEANAVSHDTLSALKVAVDNATVENVSWRPTPSVIVAFLSRFDNRCVLFGAQEQLLAHVRFIGAPLDLASGTIVSLQATSILLGSASVVEPLGHNDVNSLASLVALRQQVQQQLYTPPVVSTCGEASDVGVRVRYEELVARKWTPKTSSVGLLDEWMSGKALEQGYAALLFATRY